MNLLYKAMLLSSDYSTENLKGLKHNHQIKVELTLLLTQIITVSLLSYLTELTMSYSTVSLPSHLKLTPSYSNVFLPSHLRLTMSYTTVSLLSHLKLTLSFNYLLTELLY